VLCFLPFIFRPPRLRIMADEHQMLHPEKHIANKKWDGDGVPLAESNCAGLGGDEDKALRKAAAQTEPAWAGAGAEVGLNVWRIENFKVVAWPKETYGSFHEGDSYIVLVTSKDPDTGTLNFHIHFWLGGETTQDEMGTAAYKTVELSDLLDGGAHQSREVQNHESQQFKELFKQINYLKGGVETGFHHAAEGAYEPHLFQVRKTNKDGVRVKQVTCSRESLNQGDCFILDTGAVIYVWEGTDTNPQEKIAANGAAEDFESKRGGKSKATHDIDDDFWKELGGDGEIKPASAGSDEIPEPELGEGVLFKLSDASGSLQMTEVARGDLGPGMLDSEAVMMLDHGTEIFLWVGAGADALESRNAYCSAMNFLKVNGKPNHTPIHLYNEGKPITSTIWNEVFKGGPAKVAAPAAPPPSVAAAAAPAAPAPAPAAPSAAGDMTLADLQNSEVWHAKGVDPANRETYLADAEFQSLFGVSKADFAKLPKWKKDGEKKKHNLF